MVDPIGDAFRESVLPVFARGVGLFEPICKRSDGVRLVLIKRLQSVLVLLNRNAALIAFLVEFREFLVEVRIDLIKFLHLLDLFRTHADGFDLRVNLLLARL